MIQPRPRASGDLRVAAPYREIWCADFEFRGKAGGVPSPVCLVATEYFSGRTVRLWRDALLPLTSAPFDTGPNTLFVAFAATAELGCFLSLGWPLPANVLDLYVEDRLATNDGLRFEGKNSLLGALRRSGLPHIDAVDKEAMRSIILDQSSWSASEKQAIIDYCQTDVDALVALLPRMASEIDWPRAIGLRGRYVKAAAKMEHTGIPVDLEVYQRLSSRWPTVKQDLLVTVDQQYGVYDGFVFKFDRFQSLVASQGIPWPRLPGGRLKLDRDTFSTMAKRYPTLQALHALRDTISSMQLHALPVGADGRNRCQIRPYGAVTGRNTMKESIFGPAKWLRGLIKPPPGYGVAYVDFSAQEIGIAAGLSGDERMIDAYLSGDPYMAFARAAKLVPEDATKESHPGVRAVCKEIVLGVNYGMSAATMAERAGILKAEAENLLMAHKETYRGFWGWDSTMVNTALLTGHMDTVFGWSRKVIAGTKVTSLMNYPMQANGAEMMRIAAIAATEAGIEVCAPVHDAFLIAAPLETLDETVATMQRLMTKAGEYVTRGVPIRTEAEIVRYPDRYMDPRGLDMWERITGLLGTPDE